MPFDKNNALPVFSFIVVEFGHKPHRIHKKRRGSKMDFEQRNGKDNEMTIIDGMPATVLTGTDRTPQPWED